MKGVFGAILLVLWVGGFLYLNDVKKGRLDSHLTNAIVAGDIAGVKSALKAGADVNYSGATFRWRQEGRTKPLGIASLLFGGSQCDKKRGEICRILIQNGADYGNYFDRAGFCATGLPRPCENKIREEYRAHNL
jgi:hypothetical protein